MQQLYRKEHGLHRYGTHRLNNILAIKMQSQLLRIFNLKLMWIKVKRLFSEPLIQFIILGVILYLINMYVQNKSDAEARKIIVDNEMIGQLILKYKIQTGALPNKQQLDAMIENYIKDEISYREAKKMGLDKEDEIIRRRLIQKFDFLQSDLTETKSPTEDELKQFYENNPSLFQTDSTVSFSHIFYSKDNSTDSIAKQRALDVLNGLKSGDLKRAPEKGDRFPLQYDYTDQSNLDIQQNFGNKPILKALFSLPIDNWSGPVQSGYGWHLIYISERDSMTAIPYAFKEEEVKIKYEEDEKSKQNKKIFDEISNKYEIKRLYLESK